MRMKAKTMVVVSVWILWMILAATTVVVTANPNAFSEPLLAITMMMRDEVTIHLPLFLHEFTHFTHNAHI